MRAVMRRKMEMGERVLTFSRANPDPDAGYAVAVARLEQDLAKAEALAVQERSGALAERTANRRKRILRDAVQQELLPHLAHVGEAAAREVPEVVKRFSLQADNRSYVAFRTAAQSALDAAEAQKELLVRHGLATPLVESLTKRLAEFDEAVLQSEDGRRAHMSASEGLEAALDDAVVIVRVIGDFNRHRYAGDAERRAEWLAASSILLEPNPLAHPAPSASETPPVQSAGDQIQPAA